MIEHLVLINGMPGSGKTWLSERLAARLDYPLLARDTVKEAIYDALPQPEGLDPLTWSRIVGGSAFEVLWRVAPSLGARCVLEGNFLRNFSAHHILELNDHPTEIYLEAPTAVLHARHHARVTERHGTHQPYPLPTIEDIETAAAGWGPLDLGGPIIRVDTSQPVDVEAIAEWVVLRR